MNVWICRLLCLASRSLATWRLAVIISHKMLLSDFHFKLSKAMLCCCWPKAQPRSDFVINISCCVIKNLPVYIIYMIFMLTVEETKNLTGNCYLYCKVVKCWTAPAKHELRLERSCSYIFFNISS